MKKLLFSTILILTITIQGLSFGAQGHKAVGMIAQARLNLQAAAAVTRLLGNGVTLADVAT